MLLFSLVVDVLGEQQGRYVDVLLDCARKTWSDSN